MRRVVKTTAVTALVLAGVFVAVSLFWAKNRQSHTVTLADGLLELTGPGWHIEPRDRPEVVRLNFGSCRCGSDTAHIQVRTPFGVLHTSGRFSVKVERHGERLRMRATSDGGVIRFDGYEVRAGQTLERPLARGDVAAPRPEAAPSRITGRCIGPDGVPTPAHLKLVAGGEIVGRTTAGDDGAFAFDRMPRPGPLHVLANREDRIASARAAAEMTLHLGFATSLQGVVVDERGAPLAAAIVDVLATGVDDPRGASLGRATADAEGRFAVRGLPHRVVAVRITPADGAPSHHLDMDLRGEPMLCSLACIPARTLRGSVRAAGDLPAPGATVTLEVAGHVIAAARCDDAGRFELTHRVIGSPARPTISLRAALANAVGTTAIKWSRTPDEDIVLRLETPAPSRAVAATTAPVPARDGSTVQTAARPDCGSIRGRWVRAPTDDDGPAAPLRVHLIAVGPDATRRADGFDATGRFTLGDLPAGRYRLVAIASDGSGAVVDEVVVVARAATRVGSIALERAAALVVVVADGRDHGEAEATLELMGPSGLVPRLGRPAGGSWPPEAIRFDGFPPGRYRLRVFPRSTSLLSHEQTIELGQVETFLRVACPGGRWSGITAAHGRPVSQDHPPRAHRDHRTRRVDQRPRALRRCAADR